MRRGRALDIDLGLLDLGAISDIAPADLDLAAADRELREEGSQGGPNPSRNRNPSLEEGGAAAGAGVRHARQAARAVRRALGALQPGRLPEGGAYTS